MSLLTPNKNLVMAVAAGVYVLSPVDLAPEVVLGPAGFVDDAIVALIGVRKLLKGLKECALALIGAVAGGAVLMAVSSGTRRAVPFNEVRSLVAREPQWLDFDEFTDSLISRWGEDINCLNRLANHYRQLKARWPGPPHSLPL